MTQPPSTEHYTELTPTQPGEEPDPEWDHFVRELPRLLADGHEGKWVLLTKDRIVGFYETESDGFDAGCRLLYPESFIVQLVATYQPMIRCSLWMYFACPTSDSH